MLNAVFSVLFFLMPPSSAQNCSCPVIQCDPCQRRIVIDSQKVQCTADKSIVCENVVCENVDNYFQCVAGAAPLYVPPENLFDRITDPRVPAMTTPKIEKKPDIDFRHFNPVETKITQQEPSQEHVQQNFILKHNLPSPTLGQTNQKLPSKKTRFTAKILPELAQKKESGHQQKQIDDLLSTTNPPLVFRGLQTATLDGLIINQKKSHSFLKNSGLFISKKKQSFGLEYGETKARWHLSSGAELRFEKEGDHLVVYPLKGRFFVKELMSKNMMILDVGEWRLGKSDGDWEWETKDADIIIKNKKGTVLLRRDQLIAQTEWLEAGTELVISPDYGIVQSDYEPPHPKDKEFYLKESNTSQAPKTRRVLASTALAQEGCVQPTGEAQQCAWKCFGAKSKSKLCENSAVTQCMRFTCTAGGEWKLPTRVAGKECHAQTVVVDSCQ